MKMNFGHKISHSMAQISNLLLALSGKLETSSGPFYYLDKMTIQCSSMKF